MSSEVEQMRSVDALMAAVLGDNNALRVSAEASLKQRIKDPRFTVVLLKYIGRSASRSEGGPEADLGSRVALACVLLSRHVPDIWGELSPSQKSQVFSHILAQFSRHASQRVLQGLAELANTIAQSAAGQDNFFWEDLVRLALQSCTAATQIAGSPGGGDCPARRIVSFKLLSMVVDSLGGRAVSMYPQIMSAVLAAVTSEPDCTVRCTALTAASVSLGASDFWIDCASHLLPTYLAFVWKLLDHAERVVGRAVAWLLSSHSRSDALVVAAPSVPHDDTRTDVRDAVAILTALATNVRTATDVDSGVLNRMPGGLHKFFACHSRAAELCLRILSRDFSNVGETGSPLSPQCAEFLSACVLLLGSVVYHVQSPVHSSPGTVVTAGDPVTPGSLLQIPKAVCACTKLVAMMLVKSAVTSSAQVAWSYRDAIEVAADHTSIEDSDAARDPALNQSVVLAALSAIRSLLCGNFSSTRLRNASASQGRVLQAELSQLVSQSIEQSGQSLAALRTLLCGGKWARTLPGPGLPWGSATVQRYHMCQAWCLALTAVADAKVAKTDVPKLAQAIIRFATFQLPPSMPRVSSPQTPLALLAKLVNRRGILCLYDLVTGPWSAAETGSHFLSRWMLDLLPSILGLLRGSSEPGSEAQQSRTLMLLSGIFREQGAATSTGASIDDGTAGQISSSCLLKANALVRYVRQALLPPAAEAGSTAAPRSHTIMHVKLVLKAVFSTLLELFRISRPSAHAAVGLKLLLLVGPLVKDRHDVRLAVTAISIVSNILPVLQEADPKSVPLDQLVRLESMLRPYLTEPDFLAATLGFYAAYATVLRQSSARISGHDQISSCLGHALPAVREACMGDDGSEIKISSFVKTTIRRGVNTDGLAARRAALRCLATFARSADAPFTPVVWGGFQCVVKNREHSDAEVQICACEALQELWAWVVRATVPVSVAASARSQPFAKLPPGRVAQAAAAMVATVDSWMVTKQVVTVEHGRIAIKRVVDHDELQQKTAQFVEQTLLRPGSGDLQMLEAIDRNTSAQGGGLVAQLKHVLQQWAEQQQQPSSDDEEEQEYCGSSDDDDM